MAIFHSNHAMYNLRFSLFKLEVPCCQIQLPNTQARIWWSGLGRATAKTTWSLCQVQPLLQSWWAGPGLRSERDRQSYQVQIHSLYLKQVTPGSPPCCVLTCSTSEGGPSPTEVNASTRNPYVMSGTRPEMVVRLPSSVLCFCQVLRGKCRSDVKYTRYPRICPLGSSGASHCTSMVVALSIRAWTRRGGDEGACSLVLVSTATLGGPRPMLLTAMTRNSYSEYGLKPPIL